MTSAISRRAAEVPIFQGDDVSVIEEARLAWNRAESQRQLAESVMRSSKRLTPEDEGISEATKAAQAAADAYDAAVADAMPRAVIAKVQAIGGKAYRHLRAEHPPRADDEDDETLGFNRVTFLDALLEFFDAETGEKSLVSPDFGSKNALVEWLDNLSDGTFRQLADAAVIANQGGSPDPKVSLGSQAAQMYGAISQSRGSSG